MGKVWLFSTSLDRLPQSYLMYESVLMGWDKFIA